MCLSSRMSLILSQPAPSALVQLGSKLVLSWAQHVTLLSIDDYILATSDLAGIATFLAHATRLRSVHARCSSLRTAAIADQLFGRIKSITKLACTGMYLPAIMNPGLQELELDLHAYAEYTNELPGSEMLLEIAVIRLNTWVSSLKFLQIDLGQTPVMACESFLPELQQMQISFAVGNTAADLSWLRTQPCRCLSITVEIDGQNYIHQAHALAELQQLQLERVFLSVSVPYDSQMQAVWQQLSSPQAVRLLLHHRQLMNLESLPGSPQLYINASLDRDLTWYVAWGLVHGPQRVCFQMMCGEGGAEMVFDGLSGFVASAHEPWQLTVRPCPGLRLLGLPGVGAKAQAAPYFLQNQAAVSAGWSADA